MTAGSRDRHARRAENTGTVDDCVTATSRTTELCFGELYRDHDGREVWRIKHAETGKILRSGIASDHDYRWLLDAFNHSDEYADRQQALDASPPRAPEASRMCPLCGAR